MSPRASARTAPCTPADARARLRKAQSFVTGAELALGVGDDPLLDLPGVAAALAVLAGIAAAHAACCAALGERSRGQAHQEAIALVRTVRPHGEQMGRDLARLIQKKNNAHYPGCFMTLPGSQFRSHAYTRALRDAGLRGSMGRVGACRQRRHGVLLQPVAEERPEPPAPLADPRGTTPSDHHLDRKDLPPPTPTSPPRQTHPHRVRDPAPNRSRGLSAPTPTSQQKSGQSQSRGCRTKLNPPSRRRRSSQPGSHLSARRARAHPRMCGRSSARP